MNKKIASEIAVGIIVLVSIVIGGIFYNDSQKPVNSEQQVIANNQQKPIATKPVEQPQTQTQTQPEDETADWKTYRNDKLGFEINIPKKVSGGAIQTFENGNSVWIVTEKSDDKEHMKQFNDNSISEFKRVDGISWAILVKNVNNDQELEKFIKDRYGKNCKLGKRQPSDQEGVFDVNIDTGNGESDGGCFLNWILFVKYSPEKHKVAVWDMGQDTRFISEDKENANGTTVTYDEEMAKSFKFIN